MKPRKPHRRPGRKGTTVPLEDGGPQDPAQASLGDKLLGKLRGEGPVTFTGEERARLLAAFEGLAQENLQCRRALYGIAEAHKRHNLQVTHTDNPDGSVSFDLQPAPPDDAPMSVN